LIQALGLLLLLPHPPISSSSTPPLPLLLPCLSSPHPTAHGSSTEAREQLGGGCSRGSAKSGRYACYELAMNSLLVRGLHATGCSARALPAAKLLVFVGSSLLGRYQLVAYVPEVVAPVLCQQPLRRRRNACVRGSVVRPCLRCLYAPLGVSVALGFRIWDLGFRC
jgi:hypothetical protein